MVTLDKLPNYDSSLVLEKDKVLRWRLISFALAKGLKMVGINVLDDKVKEEIFVKDIELILKWIREEDVDKLYEFFCNSNEIV